MLIWKAFQNTEEWCFSFWNIFFRFRDIDVFSIMQIRSVMTSCCLQLKSGKYWINDISGNIEAVFLKLGNTNVHQKRNKMTPLVPLPWQQFCRWCCVNKNRNSLFCLKTRTIYPSQPNDGNEDNMGTMSARSRTLWLTLEIANGDIYFLTERGWSRKGCHGNSPKGVILFLFLMHICGAKFQEHCFNISRDIIYSVFSTF